MSEAPAPATDAKARAIGVAAIVITVGALASLLELDGIFGTLSEGMPRRYWDYDPDARVRVSTVSLVMPNLLMAFGALALFRVTRARAWFAVMGIAIAHALIASLHGLPTELLAEAMDDADFANRLTGLGMGLLGLVMAGAMTAGLIGSRAIIGLPIAITYAVLRILPGLVGLVLTLLQRPGNREDLEGAELAIAPWFVVASILVAIAWLAIAAQEQPISTGPDRGRALRVCGGIGALLLLISVRLVAGALLGRGLDDGAAAQLVPAAFLSIPGWILLALGGVGLARGGVPAGWAVLGTAVIQIVCCPVHIAVEQEARELQGALWIADTLGVALALAPLGVALLLARKLALPRLATLGGVLALVSTLFLLLASAIAVIEVDRAWFFVVGNLAVPATIATLVFSAAYFFLSARKPAATF